MRAFCAVLIISALGLSACAGGSSTEGSAGVGGGGGGSPASSSAGTGSSSSSTSGGNGGGSPGGAVTCPDPHGWSYNDGPSLCQYIDHWMQYYQNAECVLNKYWPKTLAIDPALMAAAQAEADAVAKGAVPKGTLWCTSSPCTTDPINTQDNWFYIDGMGPPDPSQPESFNSDHLMFTAPESSLVINPNPPWQNYTLLDCHWITPVTAARAWIYHYCPSAGPKPSRMGCGSAVDAKGKSWRVLLEAP